MNAKKIIGIVAGLLYPFVDIYALLGESSVLTDPSQTETVYLAINAVLEELAGKVEVIGGVWILLVTWEALSARRLPRPLNSLGVVVGVAGVLTVVPALEVLGSGFRLGEMVWGVWLGIVLVRGSRSAAARRLYAFFDGIDVVRRATGRRLSSGFRFCRMRGNV